MSNLLMIEGIYVTLTDVWRWESTESEWGMNSSEIVVNNYAICQSLLISNFDNYLPPTVVDDH